jgi:hypothetical protein
MPSPLLGAPGALGGSSHKIKRKQKIKNLKKPSKRREFYLLGA